MRMLKFCFHLIPIFLLCQQVAGAVVNVSLASWWLFGLFKCPLGLVTSWGPAVVAGECRWLVAFCLFFAEYFPSSCFVLLACCFHATVSVVSVMEVGFLVVWIVIAADMLFEECSPYCIVLMDPRLCMPVVVFINLPEGGSRPKLFDCSTFLCS